MWNQILCVNGFPRRPLVNCFFWYAYVRTPCLVKSHRSQRTSTSRTRQLFEPHIKGLDNMHHVLKVEMPINLAQCSRVADALRFRFWGHFTISLFCVFALCRGCRVTGIPENSMASFQYAVNNGCAFLVNLLNCCALLSSLVTLLAHEYVQRHVVDFVGICMVINVAKLSPAHYQILCSVFTLHSFL